MGQTFDIYLFLLKFYTLNALHTFILKHVIKMICAVNLTVI